MKEMTHRHTRELDIFYKEHKTHCTICKRKFAEPIAFLEKLWYNIFVVKATHVKKFKHN